MLAKTDGRRRKTGLYVEEEPIWRTKNKDRMEKKLQRWVG